MPGEDMRLAWSKAGAASAPQWVSDDLAGLEAGGLLRRREVVSKDRPGRVTVGGREYVDFASNDYLGLAADERVRQAVREHLADRGWGAAASPLVTGYSPAHRELEEQLADFEQAAGVLVFGSGFVANATALAALAGPQDVIFCEKRNHASLVDGCRLSRAKLRVYRGERLELLERRLGESAGYRRRWIVTDSVFSMDGDVAPLASLCDLAERFDALLYVDEAHATGVLGATGRGLAEELGVERRVTLRLGTLGKALGSVGGFLVAHETAWIDWLVNHARGYVYSTALPPACAVAALAALRILRKEPERRGRVNELADSLRNGLRALGFNVGRSATPIVPILLGEPKAAVRMALALRAEGFWAPAIRPPTVATGASRIRVNLSAAHDPADIETLLQAIGKSSIGSS